MPNHGLFWLPLAELPDLSQLRDITGIEQLPPQATTPYFAYVVVACVLAALLLVGWRWRHRLQPAPTALSPEEWAERELDRIAAAAAAAPQSAEVFAGLAADVIRQFLERRFALHAPRQTTGEFFQSLATDVPLSEEQRQLLRDFLERCDLAKFAGVATSEMECRDLLGMARAFVQLPQATP